MSKGQLAASYAALLLQDGGVAITADKITQVLEAANVQTEETYWGALMCRVFEEKNVVQLLIEGGGNGGGQVAAGATGATDTAEEEEKEPEPEPEPEEEADVGGLFDASGDDAAW